MSSSETKLDLWPYEEARKVADRVSKYEKERPVIFESGFGPSGLPHLGTMCEILRPSYVRKAFTLLGNTRATRLIVFIDDMDGLRKVPENVPRREEVAKHMGEPVSRIFDPFGCCASFSEHMVGLLIDFLKPVEVDYELLKASESYASGMFDDGMRLMLQRHQQILKIVLPELREENRASWSPIKPLCPNCGSVNATVVTAYHPDSDTVEFRCEPESAGATGCGFEGEQTVLGGKAKMQWRVDWALRWYALKVDYELYGKDLIDSARLSGQILRVVGGSPPLGFPFELFLDEQGHKVSKSVGRGVTVVQWQSYAPIEALKYFLMLNPRRARKLFLSAIPQYVDEYLTALRAYSKASEEERKASPLTFVLQSTSATRFDSELTFALIMNLVSALGTSDRELIWRYVTHYDPGIERDAETRKLAETLVECALNFYRDFVEPAKEKYLPVDGEREQIVALRDYLVQNGQATAEDIEKSIYDLGRKFYEKPGNIFPMLYKVILGQKQGPRLGVFIKLATPEKILRILKESLETR